MKNIVLRLFSLSLASFFVGCSNDPDDNFTISGNILEYETRSEVPFTNGVQRTVREMASNDVILAVNGYPLTKSTFDKLMALKGQHFLMLKRGNANAAGKMVDEFAEKYPKMFMAQRLMVDNALELGLVTVDEVRHFVVDAVRKAAKAANLPVERYLKMNAKDERLFFYENGVSYVMDKLVSEKIPPKYAVDDQFVSNVQEAVAQKNRNAAVSNAFYKAQLADLRQQILSGKITFEMAADTYSQPDDPSEKVAKGGDWGELEEDDFLEPKNGGIVFHMEKGAISKVLEDDNGLQLVKVLDIIPATTNAEGEIAMSEKRHLAHIYITKAPLFVVDTKDELTRDLKRQMQMQAIDAYVLNLATNGVNRIEYPHGRVLFR